MSKTTNNISSQLIVNGQPLGSTLTSLQNGVSTLNNNVVNLNNGLSGDQTSISTITQELTGFALLASNNAFTANNSFTNISLPNNSVSQTNVTNGYVDLSSVQTINGQKTFSNIVIPSNSISQTNVNNGYVDLSSVQTINGQKTFSNIVVPNGYVDLSSVQTVNGHKTFSNITIPNGYVDLSSNQTVNGVKTFSSNVIFSNISCSTISLPNNSIKDNYLSSNIALQNATNTFTANINCSPACTINASTSNAIFQSVNSSGIFNLGSFANNANGFNSISGNTNLGTSQDLVSVGGNFNCNNLINTANLTVNQNAQIIGNTNMANLIATNTNVSNLSVSGLVSLPIHSISDSYLSSNVALLNSTNYFSNSIPTVNANLVCNSNNQLSTVGYVNNSLSNYQTILQSDYFGIGAGTYETNAGSVYTLVPPYLGDISLKPYLYTTTTSNLAYTFYMNFPKYNASTTSRSTIFFEMCYSLILNSSSVSSLSNSTHQTIAVQTNPNINWNGLFSLTYDSESTTQYTLFLVYGYGLNTQQYLPFNNPAQYKKQFTPLTIGTITTLGKIPIQIGIPSFYNDLSSVGMVLSFNSSVRLVNSINTFGISSFMSPNNTTNSYTGNVYFTSS